MAQKYNGQVEPQKFAPELLVLFSTHIVRDGFPITKFAPSYEGPYIVKRDIGK